jgi:hypothetical protein
MNYQHAVDRLWSHSNLPRSFSSENQSLVYCIYLAEQSIQPPHIEHLVEDVIQCLEQVNQELNDANPSESVSNANHVVLSHVSYPISGIICKMLLVHRKWQQNNLFKSNVHDTLLDAVLKIAYAWDQVLAGDIDDILEGLDRE